MYQNLIRQTNRRFKKAHDAYKKLAGTPQGRQLLEEQLLYCQQRLKKLGLVIETLQSKIVKNRFKAGGKATVADKSIKAAAQSYERVLIEEKKRLEEELAGYRPAERKKAGEPKRLLLHEEVRDAWNRQETFEQNYSRVARELMISEKEVRELATAMGLISKSVKRGRK